MRGDATTGISRRELHPPLRSPRPDSSIWVLESGSPARSGSCGRRRRSRGGAGACRDARRPRGRESRRCRSGTGFPVYVPAARAFVVVVDPSRGFVPGTDATGSGAGVNVDRPVEAVPAPRLPAEPVPRGLVDALPVPPVAVRSARDQGRRRGLRAGAARHGPVRRRGRCHGRAHDRHRPGSSSARSRSRSGSRAHPAPRRRTAAPDRGSAAAPVPRALAPAVRRRRYAALLAERRRAGATALDLARRGARRAPPPDRAAVLAGHRRRHRRDRLDVRRRGRPRPARAARLAGLPRRDAPGVPRRRAAARDRSARCLHAAGRPRPGARPRSAGRSSSLASAAWAAAARAGGRARRLPAPELAVARPRSPRGSCSSGSPCSRPATGARLRAILGPRLCLVIPATWAQTAYGAAWIAAAVAELRDPRPVHAPLVPRG